MENCVIVIPKSVKGLCLDIFSPPSELKTGTQTTTNGTTFHGDILKEGTPQCDAVPATKP